MKIVTVVFAAATLSASAAWADPRDCNEPVGNANLSNITLGQVTAAKVNFVTDESFKAGCPAAGATCQKKAFVVARNLVVFDASTAKSGFVCSTYIGKTGRETDGWLPAASVQPIVPVPAPDWFGKWKRDISASIEIKRKSASVANVDGDASWQGQSGVPNVGDISATIDPRQTVQGFGTASDEQTQTAYGKGDPQACAVIFKQLGPYLFASDNNTCGGMNVTFSGIYTRR
jgi:hypothetical protein